MISLDILKKMKIKEDMACTPYLTHVSLDSSILTDDTNQRIIFEVVHLEDLDTLADLLDPSIDQMIWIIFVKPIHKHSVVYRDHPFTPLKQKGYDGVAQISIDDTYSALRFRHQSYITFKKR